MADPQETWRRLQQSIQTARQQGSRFGGAGGMPGGGSPRAALGGMMGLILLGGGAMVASNALFNGKPTCMNLLEMLLLIWNTVDGGHRAIKYTRLGGVGKEIYSEGILPFQATLSRS